MLSWPIFSSRVIAASNVSMRPMLLPRRHAARGWFQSAISIKSRNRRRGDRRAPFDAAVNRAAPECPWRALRPDRCERARRERTIRWRNRSSKPSPAGAGADLAGEESFSSEIKADGLGSSGLRASATGSWCWPSALVAVVAATAYAQINLNAWNRPFYNALTDKDMPAFIEQLGVFVELAGILLVLNVAQTWLNQTSKVVLREGLVHDLLNEWLAPMRAFRLSNSGEIGRQSRPAPPCGRPASDRSDDRPGHRPAAIDAPPAVVHRRALGAVAGHVPVVRGLHLRPAGLYGVVRAALRRRRVVPELARRPPADRPRRRALRAGGRAALRPGAGQRGNRRHRPLRRRSRREGTARCGVRDRSRNLAAHRQRRDAADLGHRRLRMVHHHRADPGGRARLFRRRDDLRRADDGGRRLQSGAAVAAVVRRQFLHHRRLARHAVARGELPQDDPHHGCARPRREPHRLGRDPGRVDPLR